MFTSPLRPVRLARDPLGLYVRAGRLDQRDLQSFIASGSAAFTGVVFEANRQAERLDDLRITLGRYAKKRRNSSFARHPVTRVARGGLR